MPRVRSNRVALSDSRPGRRASTILCAALAVLAGCGQGSSPTLGVDRGSATIPDESDDAPGAAARPLGDAIDGPEEAPPVCQSQFFGADPLALEPSDRSCSYVLASAVSNPANVIVQIAGQARATGDDENGWVLLADGTTVLLLGLACDEVLAGAAVELAALCE